MIGPLDALVAARRWDIYKRRRSRIAAHFDAYIDADLRQPGLGRGARARRAGRGGSDGPCAHAGWAYGLAAFLRAIPALEAAAGCR